MTFGTGSVLIDGTSAELISIWAVFQPKRCTSGLNPRTDKGDVLYANSESSQLRVRPFNGGDVATGINRGDARDIGRVLNGSGSDAADLVALGAGIWTNADGGEWNKLKPHPKLGTLAAKGVSEDAVILLADGKNILRNGEKHKIEDLISSASFSDYDMKFINENGVMAGTAKKGQSDTVVVLLPVEVVELAPKLTDFITGDPIAGSETPDLAKGHTNSMVEVDPVIDRIAHREIKIRIGNGNALEGKKVIWSMTPLFSRPSTEDNPGPHPAMFRGDWADSQTHSNRFEASALYGGYGFKLVATDLDRGYTEIDAQGFTAIRVNLPPIGFNKARISIRIEDVDDSCDLLDMEVPAVIVIDPGHGGIQNVSGSNANNATSPTKVMEKTMTLQYARALRDSLEAHTERNNLKIRFRMTRDSDTNPTGQERANIARDIGADVFQSFHFNATNGVARGTESLIRGTANVNEDEDEVLGRRVLDGILAAIRRFDPDGARDRGVKNYAWSLHQEKNVPSQWAVLSDTSYTNVGGPNPYHSIRGIIAEIEFIDVPAVDILLNTGKNAANVRAAVADEVRDALITDINQQP